MKHYMGIDVDILLVGLKNNEAALIELGSVDQGMGKVKLIRERL